MARNPSALFRARKKMVVGNWKLYIEQPEAAKKLVSKLRRKSAVFSKVEVGIAPSYPLVSLVAATLKNSRIMVGAQTVSPFSGGAHTGYVSAALLKNTGMQFAIVGHSERRAHIIDGVQAADENNETIAAEFLAALDAGLKVILCVGERERDAGGAHFSFIAEQLSSVLKQLPAGKASRLIIAYEPVWAIGKSAADAMQPGELREMVIFIKKTLAEQLDRPLALRVPILYGGSVEPENARALLIEGDVNGFLVGHESADADAFIEILKSCN